MAQELLRLAEANLSAQTKKAREERERLAAAELAAKLVGARVHPAPWALLLAMCGNQLRRAVSCLLCAEVTAASSLLFLASATCLALAKFQLVSTSAPRAPEEEWPDAAEIKAARRAEQDAKTPVPERCWALRNVAGIYGAGRLERCKARPAAQQGSVGDQG